MESREQKIDITRFLDENGCISQLPRKQKPRQAVLSYLAGKFQPDREYSEKEVNQLCDSWHTFNDYFILRRELVDWGFLCREKDGSRYWLTPKAEG